MGTQVSEAVKATVKGHGLAIGQYVMFHGMASDSFPSIKGTRVILGKEGAKYTLTTVDPKDHPTGKPWVWKFGAAAAVWLSPVEVDEVAAVEPWIDNSCPNGGQHEVSFTHSMSSHAGVTLGTCKCGAKVKSSDVHSRDFVSGEEIDIIGSGNHCSNGRCAECEACKLAIARHLADDPFGHRVTVGGRADSGEFRFPVAAKVTDPDTLTVDVVKPTVHASDHVMEYGTDWTFCQTCGRYVTHVPVNPKALPIPTRTKLAKRARKAKRHAFAGKR